jgi:hypothetical protein
MSVLLAIALFGFNFQQQNGNNSFESISLMRLFTFV